ncbi:MAG: GDP-mannose 4,6-dehydratase [Patescibacteria group bacterium]
MHSKRILITGGAGFIGSHLIPKLLKNKNTVFVLDDLSTGSLANLEPFRKNPKFIFKKGSVLNRKDLRPLVAKVDYIYHLAASVGVKYVVEKPLYSMVNNTEGTAMVLKLACEKKVPVLITSTSEVYGKLDATPFKETSDRMYGSAYNERWGYALSKAVDEFVALAYWREKKLPVVIVRLFNTVGPGQSEKFGMVIPRLIKQAMSGEPMTVYGDGKQVRCFGHVDDVTDALIKLLSLKKVYGEIVNLGSNRPTTINMLAKTIKKITGSSSKIVHIPYEKVYSKTFEDMRKRIPDLTKAWNLIGYKPRYTLEQIMRSILE